MKNLNKVEIIQQDQDQDQELKKTTVPTEEYTVNDFPSEMIKMFFDFVPKDQLPELKLVCKHWYDLISLHYSNTNYGSMLRFSADALTPITKAAQDLVEIQKKLHLTVMSLVRSYPMLMPFVLALSIFVIIPIMLMLVPKTAEVSRLTRKLGEDLKRFTRNSVVPEPFELIVTLPFMITLFAFEHPDSVLSGSAPLLLAAWLYVQCLDNHSMAQTLDTTTSTTINDFFNQTDSGKLIMTLLYSDAEIANQVYPPLHLNPTMSRTEFAEALTSDKTSLENLTKEFEESIKKLRFQDGKREFQFADLDLKNKQFEDYLKAKYKFWKQANPLPNQHLQDKSEKQEIEIPKKEIKIYEM